MSAKAVRWVPLDRDRCTLYEINKSMFMFMFICLILSVQPGDILCLNANMQHYVNKDDIEGTCHSMSLYNKEFVHRDFKINLG